MDEAKISAARVIIAHVGQQRKRWGRHYDIATDRKYSPMQIGTAADILAQYLAEIEGEGSFVPKEDLTRANRQHAATKAQLAKAKKQIEKLKEKLAS